MPVISEGFTYFYDNPNNPKDDHIWVVVCDPHPKSGKVVAVNFTSVKPDIPIFDTTTMVKQEEFPEVLNKPESYVYYFFSECFHSDILSKRINEGQLYHQRPFCPEKLLQRIQKELFLSPNVDKKLKAFLREHPNFKSDY